MATPTKSSKQTAPLKKGETTRKKPSPATAKTKSKAGATAKAASKESVKKIGSAANSTSKNKTARADSAKKPAGSAKAVSATKKTATQKSADTTQKSSVKSKKNTSKPTRTETKTTKAKAKTTTTKTKATKEEATKKTPLAGKKVAARRAEDARPANEKGDQPKLEKDTAPIKSEAAQKIAKSMLRRKRAKKGTAAKTKSARPIAFTLDEALEIAKSKPETEQEQAREKGGTPAVAREKQKKEVPEDVKQENRVLGAASVADILGYNPAAGPKKSEADDIPPKFSRYYKLLIELREHVLAGLDTHTRDTLKRSAKDDSGDLSSYSQHMADAGTDTFDRDFALSLVSSEQDALYEIEDAIRRIKRGTYGICEITGKPIKKERLLAVPFAKFSVEGQIEYERTHRKSAYRGGAFSDTSEEGVQFMEDDSDE